MPSWPIHIALANKLNKRLKLNDDFILGNVLPDILDGYIFKPSNITDKNLSHYRVNKRINYDLFLKENKDKLSNPIVLGYLVHLLTDKFYNKYTSCNHFVKTENGTYILLNDNTTIKKSDDTLRMKQNEYRKYGQHLASTNNLGSPIDINNLSLSNLKDLSKFNYSNDDILNTVTIINKWINNQFVNDEMEYKIYTKEELDKVFDDCYLFICDYLDKLKETN